MNILLQVNLFFDRVKAHHESTTGLHEDDVQKIIGVHKDLKDIGATIIIIEHNEDMIKSCDFAIELGPKGGDKGGEIVRAGKIIK